MRSTQQLRQTSSRILTPVNRSPSRKMFDPIQTFKSLYGKTPRVFRAPGRVNLIGEHTDYNDGFVMPAAIDFYTFVLAAPRADRKLVIRSENANQQSEFDLDADLTPENRWSDYVVGVAATMRNAGLPVQAADLLIKGNVPIGAGLSSSAAIEVATAMALSAISGFTLDRTEIAKLCQRAENEFVGARCCIMDQFISSHAKSDTALLLDCRSLEYQAFPIDAGITLVACNTMVKHDLASGQVFLSRVPYHHPLARTETAHIGVITCIFRTRIHGEHSAAGNVQPASFYYAFNLRDQFRIALLKRREFEKQRLNHKWGNKDYKYD